MPTHAPFTLLTRRLHEPNKLIEREANAQNQTTLGITHWEARIIAAAVAVRRPLSVTELAQTAHLNRDQIQSYRRGSACAPPDVSGAGQPGQPPHVSLVDCIRPCASPSHRPTCKRIRQGDRIHADIS